jgi:hypothetical protein
VKRAALLLSLVSSLTLGAFGLACSKPAPPPGDDKAPRAARGDDVGDPFAVASAGVPIIPSRPSPLRAAAAASAAASSVGATMKLLDAGRPPRRKLRYAWRHDRSEVLTIALRTTAATETEGDKPPEVVLPAVRIVVAIQPTDVTPEGDLSYAWQVTSTEVTPAPAANPELADGMRAEVAMVAHLTGTASVTSRGLAREIRVDPASVASGADAGGTGQMVEQVRQTLRDLAAPMPDEEVGRGARWEKLSSLASRDAVVTQTETFSLVELGGDRGALEDVLAQTAPPQPLRTPGAPGATPARVESMLASGVARTHFDLTRLVPASTFEGTTTMVVSGHSPGDPSRRVTMILRVGIALSGSKP